MDEKQRLHDVKSQLYKYQVEEARKTYFDIIWISAFHMVLGMAFFKFSDPESFAWWSITLLCAGLLCLTLAIVEVINLRYKNIAGLVHFQHFCNQPDIDDGKALREKDAWWERFHYQAARWLAFAGVGLVIGFAIGTMVNKYLC